MFNKIKLAVLALGVGVASMSCGGGKDYVRLQEEVEDQKIVVVDLTQDLSAQKAAYADLQRKYNELQGKYDMAQAKLNNYRYQASNQLDMSRQMNACDTQMQGFYDRLKKALSQYNSDEFTVDYVNGEVKIQLSDMLLFPSAKTTVSTRGKQLLGELANVLKSDKELKVMIEGHADSRPINTKQFKDNWELSTARANQVVRILSQDYGVNSDRLTSAGRSSYEPIATNATMTGRQFNRRVEIIVKPNMAPIYNMLMEAE